MEEELLCLQSVCIPLTSPCRRSTVLYTVGLRSIYFSLLEQLPTEELFCLQSVCIPLTSPSNVASYRRNTVLFCLQSVCIVLTFPSESSFLQTNCSVYSWLAFNLLFPLALTQGINFPFFEEQGDPRVYYFLRAVLPQLSRLKFTVGLHLVTLVKSIAVFYRPQKEGNVFTGVSLSITGLMVIHSLFGLFTVRSLHILLECSLVNKGLLVALCGPVAFIANLHSNTMYSRLSPIQRVTSGRTEEPLCL